MSFSETAWSLPSRIALASQCGAVAGALLLAACQSPQIQPAKVEAPKPPPARQGYYKVGAPYQMNGIWYYPALDLSYDETGVASILPPNFREDLTANGESFDQNALAGAHKTLPMPSVVQVTNLDNGRQIQLRINDRGSYEPGRILQMTRHASELLGMPAGGLARVRVRIMPTESIQVASLAGGPGGAALPGQALDPQPQASPRGDVTSQSLAPAAGTRPSLPQPVAPSSPPPAVNTFTPTPPAVVAAPPVQVAAAGTQRPTPVPASKPAAPTRVTTTLVLPETVRTVPVQRTQLYIQGGAFTRGDNADRARAKLARFGAAQVTATRRGKETLYRVRLGPLANIDEADRLLSRVLASGLTEAKIVVD